MTKRHLKSLSAFLLLSGFPMGIMAIPDVDAMAVQAVQQSSSCNGVVVDRNGETVIGASVVVKGTTNGTITGLEGEFSIPNVKKGDIIVISYVGYTTQEIPWDVKPLNVVLKEDTETLD